MILHHGREAGVGQLVQPAGQLREEVADGFEKGPSQGYDLARLRRWTVTWVAVYVLVRNRRGRVLLLRRSQTVKHFPGCWELPGGKPAPGENFAKTAELELSEETGLNLSLSGVAGAVETHVPGLRVAMLILEARTLTTEITLSREHDTFSWIPLSEVDSLKLRPGFDRFFADYENSPRRPKKRTARAK